MKINGVPIEYVKELPNEIDWSKMTLDTRPDVRCANCGRLFAASVACPHCGQDYAPSAD